MPEERQLDGGGGVASVVTNSDKLREFNGDFERAEMVKAFIISGEYRDRFSR